MVTNRFRGSQALYARSGAIAADYRPPGALNGWRISLLFHCRTQRLGTDPRTSEKGKVITPLATPFCLDLDGAEVGQGPVNVPASHGDAGNGNLVGCNVMMSRQTTNTRFLWVSPSTVPAYSRRFVVLMGLRID